MGLLGTGIIYGILGLVVAAAMALRDEHPSAGRLAFLFTVGALFWPLFAPVLLGSQGPRASASTALTGFEPRIRAAEAQLLSALARVKGGVAEAAIAPEAARVREVVSGLMTMATRLGGIDEALAGPELDDAGVRASLDELEARGRVEGDARVQSLRTRLRNIERLRAMRGRTHDDLERALFKMEEITSQMLLLTFAGRPSSEVAELINEIAEGVEDVTEALLSVG